MKLIHDTGDSESFHREESSEVADGFHELVVVDGFNDVEAAAELVAEGDFGFVELASTTSPRDDTVAVKSSLPPASVT